MNMKIDRLDYHKFWPDSAFMANNEHSWNQWHRYILSLLLDINSSCIQTFTIVDTKRGFSVKS